MTGLKSGSGDDLWGEEADTETEARDEEAGTESTRRGQDTASDSDRGDERDGEQSSNETQPYIVRRAIQDKSVQFEREERLTFFVHDTVVDGERDLISDIEGALGRDVPKFDVREAVYRAALRNRQDVVEELLEMGYELDDE